jgi:hypothetical protein
VQRQNLFACQKAIEAKEKIFVVAAHVSTNGSCRSSMMNSFMVNEHDFRNLAVDAETVLKG